MNNSPQVNEKGVFERMHITLQCWDVLEKVSVVNHFPHSLCLYLVFMRAENPLSHRYVVAKGISVLTVLFAKAGYSERNLIQFNFHRTTCCNFHEALLFRYGKWTGGRA